MKSLVPRPQSVARILTCVLTGCIVTACARGVERTELLGPPPTGSVPEPRIAPSVQYRALSPGILEIRRFHTQTPQNYTVEIRDLVIGPHQSARDVALGGSTILFVLGGSGRVLRRGAESEIGGGAHLVIPLRERFGLTNSGAGSLSLRAITFRSK